MQAVNIYEIQIENIEITSNREWRVIKLLIKISINVTQLTRNWMILLI